MLSRTAVYLCLVLFPASIISGQTLNTGSFLGSVKDQSGAAISGATVRILRTDPPFQREFTTDEFGNYLAPQIPPGEYRIEFVRTAFQTVIHSGIQLSAGRFAACRRQNDRGPGQRDGADQRENRAGGHCDRQRRQHHLRGPGAGAGSEYALLHAVTRPAAWSELDGAAAAQSGIQPVTFVQRRRLQFQ